MLKSNVVSQMSLPTLDLTDTVRMTHFLIIDYTKPLLPFWNCGEGYRFKRQLSRPQLILVPMILKF